MYEEDDEEYYSSEGESTDHSLEAYQENVARDVEERLQVCTSRSL